HRLRKRRIRANALGHVRGAQKKRTTEKWFSPHSWISAMLIERHPNMRIEKRILGNEGAVLLIIDNLVADPERLVRKAARRPFDSRSNYFPGPRTQAPAMYAPFLESVLNPLL